LTALLDYPLTSHQLIPFAMVGELVACGTAHADNVGPALLGGFVVIRSYEPLDIISVPINLELFCTILHPDIQVSTEEARKVLKPDVSLKHHVAQSGNVAGLIVGLMQGNEQLIGHCLQDIIAEPLRAPLITGFYDMKSAALECGALGCSISGSGPSLFALSASEPLALQIGKSMSLAAKKNGLSSQVFISKINKEGPKIVS
jgi:homoserine kinase